MTVIMKKIYTILAAVAALFAAASCNKIETNEPESESTGEVKVNITVGSLTPDTKAVKKNWENGDIIHVYLDDATTYTPDFDLTFDGTNWTASSISDAVAARLVAKGSYLHGFWESSNSCMSDASWGPSTTYFRFPNRDNRATTGVTDYIIADFSNISYAYTGGTLTASIDSWRFRSNLQIVVSGISYEANRYTLYADCMNSLNMLNTQSGSSPYECYVDYYGRGSTDGRIAGISNADGVAFVGGLVSNYSAGDKLTFYLIDNTTGVKYEFTKTLTAALSTPTSKVTAIKIPFAKFVVDMGLSVKWAAANLGAGTFTDYGDYYAWGETAPYYEAGYASETPGNHWKTGKTGYNWASYQWNPSGDGSTFTKYTGSDYSTLQTADDAATAAYGDSYRMPTNTDFEDLLNTSNCDKEWVANYLSSGVSGYLFTSKKTGYTSQKVFLPAAGYRYGASLYDAGSFGYYWSSSLNTGYPSNAWYVYFYSFDVLRRSSVRYHGFSVRPVSE